ncbi:MAG TPA: MarC family protein [Crocinitomicaceae bacterium]|nr:MarC family protein [Crocinitomicaceae bacterium]
MTDFFAAFNLMDTFKAGMVLFAVIDIVGTIPIIIDLKQKTGNINPFFTSVTAFIILVSFLILGESILMILGVDVQSFAVAGSFILFAMSLEMILGVKIFRDEASGKTASIVPLAFPLIAGAGSMTTIVSLRAEFAAINIILAIIINMAIVYVVLIMTKQIERLLGVGGIAILKKVFGIILLAIAVKLFTSNAKQLFLQI